MTTRQTPKGVGDQVSLLRRAGLPTVAVILMTAMSFPGFWEYFFNKTDDEAKVKAEVAYQLMKAQAENLEKRTERNREELDRLREMVNAMLLQRSAVGLTALRPSPVPEEHPEPPALPELRPLPANLDSAAAAAMAAE